VIRNRITGCDDLRSLVEATGLRQAEIGEQLDVHQEVLSQWIQGKSEPQYPGMLRLALQMLALERSIRENHDIIYES
jgi:transcriptional regulator with XRE-family HTH domain